MSNHIFKKGNRNPLKFRNAHFDYEVIEFGEVSNEKWEEHGRICSIPKRHVLIGSPGGSKLPFNKIFCTIYGEDALKLIKPGDLISVDLAFYVKKNDDGSYEQIVRADNLYTLREYQLIPEQDEAYEFYHNTDETYAN